MERIESVAKSLIVWVVDMVHFVREPYQNGLTSPMKWPYRLTVTVLATRIRRQKYSGPTYSSSKTTPASGYAKNKYPPN